jgi:hypothetical protein
VDPNTQEIQGTSKNETLGSDIVVNSIGSNIFGWSGGSQKTLVNAYEFSIDSHGIYQEPGSAFSLFVLTKCLLEATVIGSYFL